jgi:hypothetical protein
MLEDVEPMHFSQQKKLKKKEKNYKLYTITRILILHYDFNLTLDDMCPMLATVRR